MQSSLTADDKVFLNMAVDSAQEAFDLGNFPIGAVLVIDGKVIGSGGNKINEKKSFFAHAETSLMATHASELYEAYKTGKSTAIYSTLEPCIQCLGISVINYITKIVYITKDPQGGACSIEHSNIGDLYRNWWPNIIYAPVSEKPLVLLMQFFKDEIKRGNAKWGSHMIELFKHTDF